MSMSAPAERCGSRTARALTMLALSAGLAAGGCAVGPGFHRPPPPDARGYSRGDPQVTVAAQGVAQKFAPGAVPEQWWKLFGCAKLDAVIEEALAHNPSVAAAGEALRSSEDNLRAGYGVFYPTADGAAGRSEEHTSELQSRRDLVCRLLL